MRLSIQISTKKLYRNDIRIIQYNTADDVTKFSRKQGNYSYIDKYATQKNEKNLERLACENERGKKNAEARASSPSYKCLRHISTSSWDLGKNLVFRSPDDMKLVFVFPRPLYKRKRQKMRLVNFSTTINEKVVYYLSIIMILKKIFFFKQEKLRTLIIQ